MTSLMATRSRGAGTFVGSLLTSFTGSKDKDESFDGEPEGENNGDTNSSAPGTRGRQRGLSVAMQGTIIRVETLEGASKVIRVGLLDTLEQAKEIACQKFRVGCPHMCALMLPTLGANGNMQDEIFVEQSDNALQCWEKLKQKNAAGKFVLNIIAVPRWLPEALDQSLCHQVYLNVKRAFQHGFLACSIHDSVKICARIMQAEMGDLDPPGGQQRAGLPLGLSDILPTDILSDSHGWSLPGEVETEYCKLQGLSPLAAQREVLHVALQWPLFGCKVLKVFAIDENAKDMEAHFLAIGSDGIRLLAKDRRITATFRFSDISRWGHSETSFSVMLIQAGTPVCLQFELPHEGQGFTASSLTELFMGCSSQVRNFQPSASAQATFSVKGKRRGGVAPMPPPSSLQA